MDNKLKDKLGIFIGSHKDFKPYVTNESGCYRIMLAKGVDMSADGFDVYKCSLDTVLDDKFYSELYMMKYIADNIELPEWVGICHYRRYWSCMGDVKPLLDLTEKVDLIVPQPFKFPMNVRSHYGSCHNVDDIDLVGKIISEKFPEYKNAYDKMANGDIFLPFNMFIMRRDDFKDHIHFVWNVLDEYLKVTGTDIEKRIEENKDKYLKPFYPNNTIEYQYRIGGYLGERLTNVFIIANMGKRFKNLMTYKIDVVENKYGKKF